MFLTILMSCGTASASISMRSSSLGRSSSLRRSRRRISDLTDEHRLIAELRDALGITDERFVALGYAAQLLRASSDPDASSWEASAGRRSSKGAIPT
jgi:hypothetical protein